MNVQAQVVRMLDEVPSVHDHAGALDDGTPALGSLPELTSMPAVTLPTRIEERFAFAIAFALGASNIIGGTFATVGIRSTLVAERVG